MRLQITNIFLTGVTGPGRNVALGEVPWQVLILHDNTTYKCGGTLYDENTVITAAHW